MININLKPGDIQMQTTEISLQSIDLKSVTPIELSNMNTSDTNIIGLGIDTAVMMEIVTNSMYKDPLIALQELPANGRDAIIRRKEQGDIFSPEILIVIDKKNNEVSIRDNGCGMTRDHINKVYRIFGNSDKRNTMTETGMFGVGAKTPLALVDEYNVSTISMLTHKKLEFIVTKRAIIITQDEISTEEEPGTTIRFTIPKHDYYAIEQKIENTVQKWNCPVYISKIESDGYVVTKRLLSSNASEDISSGNYDIENKELKYIGEDYSFYLIHRDRYGTTKNKMYIGHVPYDFQYDFPEDMDVIIHNPNIITLSATREGLIKDAKQEQLLRNISKHIYDIFMPEFEKYFKHLPDSLNLNNKVKIDEQIFTVFQYMIKKDLINEADYPFYDVLMTSVKYSYLHGKSTESIRSILKNHQKILYTTKKQIPSEKVYSELENIKKLSDISDIQPVLIYLPEACTGFCPHCPEYNFNNKCDKEKEPFNTLISLFDEIQFSKIRGTYERRKGGLTGLKLHDKRTIRIAFSEKCNYIYTSESFETTERNIILVPAKKLAVLTSEGYKTIINPIEYQQKKINETYLNDINGIQISAGVLSKYTHIITGVDLKFKDIISMMFPEYFILQDNIPDNILKTLPESQVRKCFYDAEREIENNMTNTKIKVCIEINVKDSIQVLRNINYEYKKYTTITKV